MTGYSYSNKLDATSDLVSSGIPAIIDERDYCMEGYDKAFAATWFTHEEVLLGTKCNKIIMLNTRTDKRTIIGRLDECLMESTESALAHVRDLAAKEDSFTQMKTPNVRSSFGLQNTYLPRGGLGRMYDSSIASSTNNNDLGLAHTLERGLRFFNPGRRSSTPSLATAASPNSSSPTATNSATSPIATAAASTVVTQAAENAINGANTNITTNSPGDMSPGTLNSIAAASTSTGIRSLSINPSRTLLAIGSGDPFQVTIYAIPEFEPVGMMYGHTDLVFSLTWISDTVLVTGARDGSMRVWTMGSPVLTNLHSVTREVKVHLPVITRAEQLMTLTTEGYVKLWDRESYVQLSKLKLIHSTETVCLTANSDANLFAVGSQSHISIIDPRSTSIVHDIDSCDEGWGVRALDFKSHIITTGGGFGRIGYYDVRAQRYLDGFNNGESTKRFQEIGPGWLNRDTAYAMSISGITIRNAVYTLEYDSTGTRLFAAGGPLQLGLCGAYAALWA
ncbi:WD40-repeat-containing domain protein [Gamsiella multidivaricata]|uniref:WD40-repeat-containing domain protein n=1 Tax=Gamsiella multidivaricata TaxID=101098 RepID=UPI00222073CE|nr:WD40-repeat-containing domain protein [Gamsiella multidivaricata]KAI7816675.1 WD40-repeat-containing domain protein [Gamsiella multidivaricata]